MQEFPIIGRKNRLWNLHDCRGLQDMVSSFCSLLCFSMCSCLFLMCSLFSFRWSVPLNCLILDLATCKSDLVFFFFSRGEDGVSSTSDRSIRQKLFMKYITYTYAFGYVFANVTPTHKNFKFIEQLVE